MNIFILRHGHAQESAPSDQMRALSAQGELDVHKACQDNYAELSTVEHVFFSPYLRATQTADIARQYLTASSTEVDLLVPNGRIDEIISFLFNQHKQYENILLVSHQPLVGMLVDALGGFEPGRYRMGTSSLAKLVCDPVARDCCTLNWLVHS